jgi:hypothetical protein
MLGMDYVFCEVGTELLHIIYMTIGVNILTLTHSAFVPCLANI